MKNKKKAYIDTYETLYPVQIVVANEYATIDQLRKLYTECDGTELQDDDMNAYRGIVIRATRKSDGAAVLLIRMMGEDKHYKDSLERKIDYIGTIAHEAAHAVLETYIRIEEKNCTHAQEPFCYYLEFIVKCICKTVFKK